MSYRDDVDALFHRARTLQAEVDRLRDELAATRAGGSSLPGVAPMVEVHRSADAPGPAPRAVWLPAPWRSDAPELSAAELIDELHRTAPSEPDEQATWGLLVARLSAVEHALVTRLLELLGEDDFRRASVAARVAAFDQLMRELRERLATPG